MNEKDEILISEAAASAMKRLDKAQEVNTGALDLRGGKQREGFRIWLEDAMLGVATTIRKEARQQALKEAIAIIVGQPTSHYIYSGAQPMAAETFRDNAVKTIEATMALEAAAEESQ